MTVEQVIDQLRILGEKYGFGTKVWGRDERFKGPIDAVFMDETITETDERVAVVEYQYGLGSGLPRR